MQYDAMRTEWILRFYYSQFHGGCSTFAAEGLLVETGVDVQNTCPQHQYRKGAIHGKDGRV